MSIEAGEINQRITLLRSLHERDAEGEVRKSSQDSIKVWAKVEALPMPEQAESGTTQSIVRFKFKIRYREVPSSWKIDYRGQLLSIESAIDPEQTREFLLITAYAPKT